MTCASVGLMDGSGSASFRVVIFRMVLRTWSINLSALRSVSMISDSVVFHRRSLKRNSLLVGNFATVDSTFCISLAKKPMSREHSIRSVSLSTVLIAEADIDFLEMTLVTMPNSNILVSVLSSGISSGMSFTIRLT